MARSNEPAFWMWTQACEMLDEADRLHRQFFRPAESARAMSVWAPPVDVFEDPTEFVIVVAMPGVAADCVQVSVEPGAVVVRGTRPMPLLGGRHTVRHLEIPYGGFERRINLPPIALEAGSPELSHGCLVLRLRKIGGDAQ